MQSKIHYEPWYSALPILYASTAPETLDANGKVNRTLSFAR
jgi:hypothetical protein